MDPLPRRAALKGAATLALAPIALAPAALVATALASPALALDRTGAPADARLRRPLFGAVAWRLENGLTVVLAENRRAPVAAHFLYVPAGGGEDPPGRAGTAHFLEHMMFKGSPNIPSGAFSRTVAYEGGQDNAFTSRDVTAYFQNVEASRLPLMMRMESDRLGGALIPEAEMEPERGVILEERRQVVESIPRRLFRENFDAAMFGPQHWRGRSLIGPAAEIRAITRDDLTGFHRRHYDPDGCVLVVAGDVREADLRRWADQFYAPVPSRKGAQPAIFLPDRGRAQPPAAAPQPRLVERSPVVREGFYLRAMLAPSVTWGDTDQTDPLDLLAHILGGGPGSRLHAALVESGMATSAGADADTDSVGAGGFAVFGQPRPGVAMERFEAVFEGEIQRLLDRGITDAELARSRRQTTAGALLALDGLGAAPRMIGGALAIGQSLEDVEHWPERIAAVTRAQVEAAARAVLGEKRLETTGWLVPAA